MIISNKFHLVIKAILLLLPILCLLHGIFYKQLGLQGTAWDLRITKILLISLPVSAIYFLFQKGWYDKVYGVLICLYIVYLIFDFLKETSGAI